MDSLIHGCLDGERSRDELTGDDRHELAALEATIDSVAGPLRAAAAPDLSARVMARISEIRREPSLAERIAAAARQALDWLWTPRPLTIRLRPAYALGSIGALSLFVAIAPFAATVILRDGLRAGADAPPTPRVYVQFRLEATGASHVALAGSFNDWKPEYELRQTVPGTWSILLPLHPGIHDYAFVLDGREWVADPHALRIDDGFGGANSRIALPSPTT